MASSNLKPRHRDSSGTPQLQVHRRSSHSRPIEIPRIAVSPSGTSSIAPYSAPRSATTNFLSTSAPDALDTLPILHQSLRSARTKTFGVIQASQASRTPQKGEAGSSDGLKNELARVRPRQSNSSLPLTTGGPHRTPPTRSFLLAAGSGNPGSSGGGGKVLGTMSPLPKHQRTSKTSQKLVVLPSAPQTKPLSKQLVLLDEEQESSDDSAHPHGFFPPRRIAGLRKPFSPPSKLANVRVKAQDEDDDEGKERMPSGDDSQQHSALRVRDYKSSAERMTKEERKQAGHKRMTAYCIAEGLKMKVLAGFLKREHNVLPRVFDEALYVMYHLPLLPGYGPQTNVRSSAPPPIELASSAPGSGFQKSILTRLEEAEENGYQGSYFPQTQDLIDLAETNTDAHRMSAQGFDGFTTDGEQPDPSMSSLPGWVQPAEVDEVREQDGYVTSSSLPREEESMRKDMYSFEYSTSSSTPSTLRKQDLPLPPSEQTTVEHLGATTTLLEFSSTPPSTDTFVDPYIDSGVETDDPGVQTDPGVYGSPRSPTRKGDYRTHRVRFSGRSPMATLGERSREDTEDEVVEEDMAASTMTTKFERPSASETTAASGSIAESESEETTVLVANKPHWVRAMMLPVMHGVATNSDAFTNISNDLFQDELHTDVAPSPYERQLLYEREREGQEEILELERERQRQFEYERALEREQERERERQLENVAEAVFFEYGVVVFFGLTEREERNVLDDIGQAGVLRRPISEDEFEVEECHFAHDPNISYPRIYNDFFTLKSRSHLLKLSIAHALAQSTLLARYETLARRTLSSPLTLSIPRQLASSGSLQLRRHEALKLTGRLFKLRRDVNLVSNVLDVPELFWSEASLKDLYDAVREYMEIGPRVENLNEKLGVASDFLDAIHDHLNNNAMERITWIIIWLIVVAVLVELGEIIARLTVHAGIEKERAAISAAMAVCFAPSSHNVTPLSKEDALLTLEKIMRSHA